MAQDSGHVAEAAPGEAQAGLLMRLLKHFSNYSFGSFFVTVASLISFPILTRIFSVSEYGVLALVNSTLGFLVGCGKFGVQFSIVRFYAEVETGQRASSKVEFFTTVLISMSAIGAVISAVAMLAFSLTPAAWWKGTGTQYLIAAAAPLVLIRTVDSGVLNLLRAQHLSRFYSMYTAVRRYLGLGFVLGVVLLVQRSLLAFYAATIVAEGAALLYGVRIFLRQGMFRWRAFSMPLLRAMLDFGMPLFASNVVGLLLGVAGRYLINFMLGSEPLGVYSAAANLADYMVGMFALSFAIAVEPMYFRQWEQQGPQKTREFLAQALKYYLLLACPILAGMAAVGPELIRLLASSKYDVSRTLVVFQVAGLLVSGGFPIFCAGVNVKKMTKVVLYSTVASSVTSIVVTAWTLPYWGIEGAAFAVLVSSLQYSITTAYYGRKVLAVPVPLGAWLRFALASGAMYEIIRHVTMANAALQLVARLLLGFVAYTVMVLALDRELRGTLRGAWGKLRRA